MKKLFLILLVSTLIIGCVGTKKYSSFVYQKVAVKDLKKNTVACDYIQIKIDDLVYNDSLVMAKKIKSQFIPAVLYWQWENTIKCVLHPSIPANTLMSSIVNYANEISLKEKLHGNQIEISIQKIPNSFMYRNTGNAIILIFGYITYGLEAIYPQTQNLTVTYRVLKENQEVKKGTISINNDEDQPVRNIWKSTKKFTWNYIDQYNLSIETLGKQLVEKLSTQI